MNLNLLCDQSQWAGVLKVMKNDHFKIFFSGFGDFPQFFGQVKEKLLLELDKMIRVSQVVACQIGLNICFEIKVSREECPYF